MQQQLAQSRHQLLAQAAQLEALSPLAILRRGYAVLTAADGTIVHDAQTLETGDVIRARLGSGSLEAEVRSINLDNDVDR
jgi:exodeoxyribonuclease VII large subunit